MNNNSSLSFDPISNIRLTRMPSRPQLRDKLRESAGVRFRISERFVYKPRLNTTSAWQLYDGLTVPRKEDLILVGNPNMRSSKLVYTLADQAEYHILDISEIPFVTLATTRNIISSPARMCFGQPNNNFQFTFGAQGMTTSESQIPPAPSASTQPRPQLQSQPEIVSSIATCIAAIASCFDFTSQSHTAQKRSRETAFKGDNQDMEANCHQRYRPGTAFTAIIITIGTLNFCLFMSCLFVSVGSG